MIDLSDNFTGAITCALLAVLATAFLTTCIFFALLGRGAVPLTQTDFSALLSLGAVATLVTAPFALVVALVVGLPVLRFLQRRGHSSVGAYFLGGAALSVASAAFLAAAHAYGDFLSGEDYPLALWIIGIGGPVAALTARSLMVPASSSNNRFERSRDA